jgi:hypothetical protein
LKFRKILLARITIWGLGFALFFSASQTALSPLSITRLDHAPFASHFAGASIVVILIA